MNIIFEYMGLLHNRKQPLKAIKKAKDYTIYDNTSIRQKIIIEANKKPIHYIWRKKYIPVIVKREGI